MNKNSVLAAGLKYLCSAGHITESKGDRKYNNRACTLK